MNSSFFSAMFDALRASHVTFAESHWVFALGARAKLSNLHILAVSGAKKFGARRANLRRPRGPLPSSLVGLSAIDLGMNRPGN